MSDIDWSSRNFPGTVTIPPPNFGSGYNPTALEQYFKSLQELNFADESRDKQVGGSHYRKGGEIQPWDIIKAWELDFWEGNVVKYVLRWKHKDGVQDLKKARHYLEYLIEQEEKNELKTKGDFNECGK